ncbi:MAG: S41 family peptidase [Saprospiraceae bacterium]|nr:S41 family peptidase [Saprospiraceae bacterium]
MKKASILILFIAFFGEIRGQSECNCAQNFTVLQQKVRNNYAGFDNRINAKNKAVFAVLTDSVAKVTVKITDGYACYTLMERWISFFRDGHLYLTTTYPPTGESPNSPKMTGLDSLAFDTYLKQNKDKLSPLEGIWRDDDGSYMVAIKRDDPASAAFSATILKAKSTKWKVGMQKFILKGTEDAFKMEYFMGDFSVKKDNGKQQENLLILEQLGAWEKVFPEPKIKLDPQKVANDQIANFKILDDQTSYLRVKTFNAGPDVIDNIIKENRERLLNTPRLIIDIRGNGGGSNSNYHSILPFFYTQPYTLEGKGAFVLASEDNIAIEKKTYEQAWNSLSEESKKMHAKDYDGWKKYVDTMAMNQGKRYYYAPSEVTKFDSITTNPKQVAILMDKNCYSTAEWFVMEAEYSKKVTLFGQNTGGVMDNTNVRPHALACPAYTILAASGRRGGADEREIDNIGFKPNVYIDEKEEDWVKFVLDYWEKK